MRYDHYPERKGTYGVEGTHNLYTLHYRFCVDWSNSLAVVQRGRQCVTKYSKSRTTLVRLLSGDLSQI